MKHEIEHMQPIFIGHRCAGHLLRHTKGWSVFDANDRLVGQSYGTPDSAISALRSLSLPST